jgi:hypothetical protein
MILGMVSLAAAETPSLRKAKAPALTQGMHTLTLSTLYMC